MYLIDNKNYWRNIAKRDIYIFNKLHDANICGL